MPLASEKKAPSPELKKKNKKKKFGILTEANVTFENIGGPGSHFSELGIGSALGICPCSGWDAEGMGFIQGRAKTRGGQAQV